MVARAHDGTTVARTVTSCGSCLAWGLTFAQGLCLACYNFSARHHGHPVGDCGACHRLERLKKGYCRLCWHQARLDRAVLANDPRSAVVLAPYLPQVTHQQLFLADTERRTARPRSSPRRYGAKGRPRKTPPVPAGRPRSHGIQLPLFDAGPRTYRLDRADLRRGPAPDNPWLAWALHLAHLNAEARGWGRVARGAMQRALVMLLADHVEGDRLRVSDFAQLVVARCINLDYVVEILTTMDVVDDDRPPPLQSWLDTRLAALTPAIRADLRRWAEHLRDGGPRSRPRQPTTVRAYVTALLPAALDWSERYDHLREVTRADLTADLAALTGRDRQTATTALRSLFAWAKATRRIFTNPAARLRSPRVTDPVWQPLTAHEISASVTAATTVQARLFLALAAIHAARPGQIRALHLEDVDLPNRRITIAGHSRPLDGYTCQALLDWFRHRADRWPATANPHLLISKETALGHGPVSSAWILNLRRLPGTIERLRIDRQLDEALATAGDPLHLAVVFNLSEATAIRWALNAKALLNDSHATRPHDSPGTEGSLWHDESESHLGSRRARLGSSEPPEFEPLRRTSRSSCPMSH